MKKFILIGLFAVLSFVAALRTAVGTYGNPTPEPPSVAPQTLQAVVTTWDTTPARKTPEALQAPEETTTPEPEWKEFTATAYCSCEICCGSWALNRPNGIVYTASGAVAREGYTIAADWDVLPPGTIVFIEGLGERVVQDRGSAVKGNAVDLYFEDHTAARNFGRRTVRLYIVEE